MSDSVSPGSPGLWFTVPEAAARLGIHEKRLYRLIARPENADTTGTKTRTGTRATRTGTRTATELSEAFIEELAARLAVTDAPASPGASNVPPDQNTDTRDRDADGNSRGTQTSRSRTGTLTLHQAVAVYERLIAEKDKRLADKDAEIERQTNIIMDLSNALARAQALQAMNRSIEPMEEVEPPKETTSSDLHGENALPVGKDAHETGTLPENRSWWQRLQFWRAG